MRRFDVVIQEGSGRGSNKPDPSVFDPLSDRR
jgi:hypothetical protein